MAKFKVKRVIKDQKNFALLGTALASAAITCTTMGVGKLDKDAKNIVEGNTEELK